MVTEAKKLRLVYVGRDGENGVLWGDSADELITNFTEIIETGYGTVYDGETQVARVESLEGYIFVGSPKIVTGLKSS